MNHPALPQPVLAEPALTQPVLAEPANESVGPRRPLGSEVVHRLRRPGRNAASRRPPGDLGSRAIRFATALTPRALPSGEPLVALPGPGRTLAAAVRTEVSVHRLAQVQAAGSMLVPRDLLPLQPPAAPQ